MGATTLLILSVAIIFIGTTIHYIAWLYCRREGVDDRTWIPFWRARPYLNKHGLRLWWLGTAVVIVGVGLLVVAANMGSQAH
jgi:hypothetical protein